MIRWRALSRRVPDFFSERIMKMNCNFAKWAAYSSVCVCVVCVRMSLVVVGAWGGGCFGGGGGAAWD